MVSSFFYFYTLKNTKPIGIFDSGVGGTSIWKEIHELLPYEDTIYLADSQNAPYGDKSVEDIISFSIKNTEILLEMGCKIIVVACNTATTNAISVLRQKYSIPFIGIEPAIKPAALQTLSKSIGVLATKGTLSSDLFSATAGEFTTGISKIEVIGKGLVPLIEEGKIDSPEVRLLLKKYTQPMLEASIDYLVLGCSHYPYLIPQLRNIIPKHIKIIDSGEAVAKQTKNILQQNLSLKTETSPPKLQFYSNASLETMRLLLKDYLEEITLEEKDF